MADAGGAGSSVAAAVDIRIIAAGKRQLGSGDMGAAPAAAVKSADRAAVAFVSGFLGAGAAVPGVNRFDPGHYAAIQLADEKLGFSAADRQRDGADGRIPDIDAVRHI